MLEASHFDHQEISSCLVMEHLFLPITVELETTDSATGFSVIQNKIYNKVIKTPKMKFTYVLIKLRKHAWLYLIFQIAFLYNLVLGHRSI